ncbi:MAG: hypothetical protein ABIH34_02830, partial [Nanoarchaeota archaeon]
MGKSKEKNFKTYLLIMGFTLTLAFGVSAGYLMSGGKNFANIAGERSLVYEMDPNSPLFTNANECTKDNTCEMNSAEIGGILSVGPLGNPFFTVGAGAPAKFYTEIYAYEELHVMGGEATFEEEVSIDGYLTIREWLEVMERAHFDEGITVGPSIEGSRFI